MRASFIPHRVIRNKVGIKVLSNPTKKSRRLEAENVIVKANKIISKRVIKVRWLRRGLICRCLILARSDTGSSQILRRIRGELMESLVKVEL